jgi:hypothetical protein
MHEEEEKEEEKVEENEDCQECSVIQDVSQINIKIEDYGDGLTQEKSEFFLCAVGFGESRGVKCCVCLEEFREDSEIRKMQCSHFVHLDCIMKYVMEEKKERCPDCDSLLC